MADFQSEIDKLTLELKTSEESDNFTRADLQRFRQAILQGGQGPANSLITGLEAETLAGSATLQGLQGIVGGINSRAVSSGRRRGSNLSTQRTRRTSLAALDQEIFKAEDELRRRERLSGELNTAQENANNEFVPPPTTPVFDPETGIPFALSPAEVEQREADDIAFSTAKDEIDAIAKDPNATPEQRDAADNAADFVDQLMVNRLQEELNRSEDARNLLLEEQVVREQARRDEGINSQRTSIAQRLGISTAVADPFAVAAKREKAKKDSGNVSLGNSAQLGQTLLGG